MSRANALFVAIWAAAVPLHMRVAAARHSTVNPRRPRDTTEV
jgi:hypothetical protein